MSLKNCLIVLWVYIMYVLGIWLFLSGFLLKRIVIHQHSTLKTNIGANIQCKDITSLRTLADLLKKDTELLSNETHLQRFDKIVILVIDALRYDFTYRDHKSNSFYSDKMPVFQKLIHNRKGHALLFQLVADPPTTTLQRLTGITTGSLPTFIDVSFNFASSEIREDNLIYQMKNFGKKITFMGDDTWENIFPKHFYKSYPYPSFNVKDLDTVDDGILNHLYEEVTSDENDVVVAHFLGVDHCGHRYGPNHPEMTRKLRQMNKVVEKVAEKINSDTLLAVLGDHGMTENGDHGGDSPQETSTALFLFSPSKLGDFNLNSDVPTIQQVDIVPTLSLLLGLPIPFSNLGSAIGPVFTLNFNDTCFHEKIDPLVGRALVRTENIIQVHRYLQAYSQVSDELSKSFVTETENRMKSILQLWTNITNEFSSNVKIFSTISEEYEKLLLDVRAMCEKKWATFNVHYMTGGCIILFFAIIFNLIMAEHLDFAHFLLIAYGFGTLSFLCAVYFYNSFQIYILPTAVIMFYFFTKLLKKTPESCFESFVKLISIPTLFLFIFFVTSFSNSFVIHEDTTTIYLLLSSLTYRFLPTVTEFVRTFSSSFTYKNKSSKRNPRINWRSFFQPLCLVCLLLCIRVGSLFYKCREEQSLCENSDLILSLEKLHGNKTYKVTRLLLSLLSVILPSVIFLAITNYKYSGRPQTISAISVKYGTFFVSVLISLRWWLNILSPTVIDRVLKGSEIYLSRTALIISLLLSLLMFVFPILSEQAWQIKSKEIYHASFLSFLFCILQFLQLTAGDALSTSIMLMSLSTLFYIVLVNSSLSTEKWIWNDVIIYYLLSRHWFYATAHQPTFTAIQWDAAFLVNHKEIYSYILSGALVILNTFCSNLFYGLTLPILLTCTESSIFTSKSLLRLHMKYTLCFGIKLLGTVLTAFVLRRHLMVWKIFSPKLIYEILGFIITMLSACIGHLFLMKLASHYHNLIRKNLNHVFESKDQ